MFDRRLIQYFDWGLLLLTLLLCAVGLMTLYSAVAAGESALQKVLYFKQWVWYGVGFAAMTMCFVFDYKHMDRMAYGIYGLAVLLLGCVLLFGKLGGGSRRWLALGPVSLQPSELAKIAVIIILARYYSRRVKGEGFSLRELVPPFLLTAFPFVLIVRQPDLGTGLIIFLIAGTITLFVKIKRRSLVFLVFMTIAAIFAGSFFLKDYQKQRIMTFLNPDRDPLGAGYHIIQSKIAIGSGMITGKGLLKGTQNTLSFLPEQHTDFIFSVLAEEWGGIGASFITLLFMTLIIWGLNIAYNCRDHFGTILSVGVTAMIFWQAFINLGMVMGLMPVVGVPLPLISYGGSSILTIMVCIGILMNVSMRRFVVE
ncbi:rod shape-determining protein RodA [Desulfonema ishimotonii]|uniref:Peptidoglycan glycosyltransferase RodA n=2 Tax=Desulfonema ishimotonii TaxID=45657 RepID=A0A401G4L8_9BACT|nr:rod shape-determining protein RodA [Desulfonema ishimotonii]GBC64075.1 rod shape-determining protein RodA [Desulfonema ishimotonii]